MIKKLIKNVSDSIKLFLATDMPLYSANAAFFLVISSIPIFMLMFSLFSFIPMVSVDEITKNINLLFPNLPYVKNVLTNVIDIANNLSTKGVISINLFTAFVAGSTALYSFIIGIRKIHNITYKSSYIRLRILSLVNMLIFFIAIYLMLIAFILGSMILGYVKKYLSFAYNFINAIFSYRYIACSVIIFVLMLSLYTASTNFERKFKHNVFGALFTTVFWLLISNIYSFYFKRFPLSASVYGSVAGIVVVLLWLYTCINIIFFGAVVNEVFIPEEKILKEQQKYIQMKLSEGRDKVIDNIINQRSNFSKIKKIERPDLSKDE